MIPEDFDNDSSLNSKDRLFLGRLREVIERNLENEKFGVEDLAGELDMSRVSVYRKFRRLSGKSINQYIREVRLGKAMELLQKNEATVSEIAFQAGFGSPTYFIRCFKKEFGISPGEYAKNAENIRNSVQHEDPGENDPARSSKKFFRSGFPAVKRNFWFVLTGLLSLSVIFLLLWYLPAIRKVQELLPEVMYPEKSIVVMPFRNESEDPDNEYFCSGIHDEILNHLIDISAIEVKSGAAVETYTDGQRITNIAENLKVSYILEGSVRKYENRFRISVRLTDMRSGNQVWGETYDGVFSDTIFIVQSHIAEKVASSLNALITKDEKARIENSPTRDFRAYDFTIRGKYENSLYWRTGDKKHLEIAHEHLDRALKIDPEFQLVYVLKGKTFVSEKKYDSVLIYAKKAIAIDPDVNRGYNLMGDYYFLTGENDKAMENYLKAIELPPYDDLWLFYHVTLGELYLNQKNDVINALFYLQKGLTLSEEQLCRVYPLIIACFMNIGNYDRAEEYIQKSLEFCDDCTIYLYASWIDQIHGSYTETSNNNDLLCQDPECYQICLRDRFQISLLKGEFSIAEQYFDKWKESGTLWRTSDLYVYYQVGYVYYQLGRHKEAEDVFREQINNLQVSLEKNPEWKHPNYMNLARIYAFTGNHPEALKYLKKYAETGFAYGWHDFIENDPFFESLRENPEFRRIVGQAQKEKVQLREVLKEMEARGEIRL